MSKRPLSSLLDPYDAKPANLDPSLLVKIEGVNAAIQSSIARFRSSSALTNPELALVLSAIISAAPPEARMRSFKSLNECTEWIGRNPLVAATLRSAIHLGHYGQVMLLRK